jgi:hypothetical protein
MKPFMIICILLCCGTAGLAQDVVGGALHPEAVVSVMASAASPNDCRCGDADCNGVLNWGDGVYILNYLFGGGPLPLAPTLEQVDWDNHQLLTISDVWCVTHYVFTEWPGPQCPPGQPPLTSTVDSSSQVYYTNRIRPGVSQAAILLTLKSDSSWTDLAFPVRIRVDGQIPVIDSIVFDIPIDGLHMGASSIYSDSGCAAIGVESPFFDNPETARIATLYVTVPPSPEEKHVTMEWVNLSPIQAPTPDNSITPTLGFYLQCLEPVLTPDCCLLAGDVNDDGKVNVGDAVYLITHVFQFGPPPPCRAQADPNNDGTVNIGDAVFLINYIFRGGPVPTCL